ncbi:MAG: cell division protein FtsH [Desulfobulbaceae bacterium BRH_c16a]|nr:MAG: cell division protein FtsH [Desulfobulbaceae bacterium BRH_c16a]
MAEISPERKFFDFQKYPPWFRLLLFFIFWMLITYGYIHFWSEKNVEHISYSVFKSKIINGEVAEVQVQGQEVSGRYEVATARNEDGRARPPQQSQHFQTVIPSFGDPDLIELLEENKVSITARPEKQSWFASLLIVLLPWLLIIGFFVYMNKKMSEQMGTGGPFGFGKSKAKRFVKEESTITFDDVAGLENVKYELEEMVEYLKSPGKFQSLGAQLPKGVLLVGPPGTGKTLLARAMAGEAGVPYYSISGSEFIEMFVGVGASRVRDMFKTAKENAPSLIFIDELDSIGRARGTGIGGGHDEREQTLNQILSEIDGFSPNESVIVLAATNRPDVLDPALIRPGRFDRQITLDMPQKKARKEILAVHAGKVAIAEGVDLDLIAGATVGFSGADLKNLVNEAALLAARKGKQQVEMEDFHEARDKITMGVKREDQLSEEEKKMVAYHEAGHALTALMLPGTDPLSKVSIIPRGRSLGATEQVPKEDRHSYSKTYLLNRIVVMLGGRAAEQLVFGEITSGAADDLKRSMEIARRMVCQWGMSDKVGLVVFRKGETHPFLGRELTEEKDYGEATAEKIDEEIKAILERCYEKSQRILENNLEKLKVLAEELINRETLTLAQIQDLFPLEETRNHEQ